MTEDAAARVPGQLSQWPAQIQPEPVNAPWLDGTDLPAAGCAAFAYGNFHADFMRGHATVIGCPKLDGVDCAGKLSRMLSGNSVCFITVARMEAPTVAAWKAPPGGRLHKPIHECGCHFYNRRGFGRGALTRRWRRDII